MKTKSTTMGHSQKMNETWEWFDGTETLHSGGSYSHDSWVNSVTYGDNLRNWRYLIANGFNATTYLSGERKSRTYTPGFCYVKQVHKFFGNIAEARTVGPMVNSVPSFPSDPSTISIDGATRKALTKFNSRTLEVNTAFNGGVFLGELGQTLRGIKRPAESLFRSIGSYRREAKKLRSKIVKSKDHLRRLRSRQRRQLISSANQALTGLWLESQFHWKPLLSDIDSGAKALAELSVSPKQVQIISASASESTAVFNPVSFSLGLSGSGDGMDTVVSTAHVRFKGAVGVQPRQPGVPNADYLGLGLRNFIPTIWELMPYSFVADYFTNIGDVIQGLSTGGYNVRWCFVTTRRDRTHTRTINFNDVGDTFFWRTLVQYKSAPQVVASWTQVQRENYSGSFVPSLTWELPGLSLKWLNLGALFSARTLDRFL